MIKHCADSAQIELIQKNPAAFALCQFAADMETWLSKYSTDFLSGIGPEPEGSYDPNELRMSIETPASPLTLNFIEDPQTRRHRRFL